jgi:hypothetical protein
MAQAEKKIEIDVDGRKIRIMPHMSDDLAKFGGTARVRILKEPPRELFITPLPKKIILPRTEIKPLEIIPDNNIKLLEKTDIKIESKAESDGSSDYPTFGSSDYPKEIIPEVKLEKKVIKKPAKKTKK